jgi:hypothetical protein
MKVGRNDLCPCGSGKKFKKCHLGAQQGILIPASARKPPVCFPPNFIRRAKEKIKHQQRKQEDHLGKFGHVMPIVHVPNFQEKSLVAVGPAIYHRPAKSTFTNFLFNYGLGRFGDEWIEEQNQIPLSDKHPLFLLHLKANQFVNKQPLRPEGYVTVKPNGPLSFCESFYYDLYTVANNSNVDEELMHRLRNRDLFQGAAHELFVEATCLRAGFSIIHERNSTVKHAEFVAVHKATSQHVVVEAKSRHRPGIMAMAGVREQTPNIRFGALINDAIKKDPSNPVAIFVDTNMPADKAARFYAPTSLDPVTLSKPISRCIHRIRSENGSLDPYNLLVFTNHPQHYSEDDAPPPGNHWAGFISDKPRVPVFQVAALHDLLKALELYGNIPTDFPELVPGTNIPE